MAGKHRHDSPDADTGASGFLARWSARKRAGVPVDDVQRNAAAALDVQRTETGKPGKVLTDQDMPPLESLDEGSDYSGFLSPGVSDALQRLALRKLFSAARFQVRDGLDDYDTDYNRLLPLPRVLAGVSQDALTQQLQRAGEKLSSQAHQAGADAAAQRNRPDSEPDQDEAVPDQAPERIEPGGQ
jgi:hypothetical protein